MPLAQSVVGYLPDSVIRELQGGSFKSDTLELPLEPGKQGSHVQVKRSDIYELRLGPAEKGHTSVQIILAPNANFSFTSPKLQEGDLLSVLRDPTFIYGLAKIHWIAIYVGPILRQEGNVFRQIEARQ